MLKVKVSPGLRLLRLTVPLAAMWLLAQYWWLSQQPIWSPPLEELFLIASVMIPVFLVLIIRATLGFKGSEWALFVLAFIWIGVSCVLAIFTKSAFGGLLALGISLYWIFNIWMLRRENQRAYSNPTGAWWSGLPQAIPNVVVELVDVESAFRVAALDHYGCTVFSTTEKSLKSYQGKQLLVRLKFQGKSLELKGILNRMDYKGQVFGVRFIEIEQQDQKQLEDWCELLAGRGYEGVAA